MNELDFATLSDQITSPIDAMYQPSRLDTFIIKSYQLLSQNGVINVTSLYNTPSPQTAVITPISNTTDGNSNTLTESVQANSNNLSLSYNGMKDSPEDYTSIFLKMSQIYNATIAMASNDDDQSTSPKSPIELWQKFQQIIKELELSFDVSQYGRYFNKLGQESYAIKDDAELSNEPLWQEVVKNILSVYEPQTGALKNQGRKKVFTTTSSPKRDVGNSTGSTATTAKVTKRKSRKNDKPINTAKNIKKNNIPAKAKNSKIKNSPAKGLASNAIETTINNGTLNPSILDATLNKKFQPFQQDVNSRSLSGYYTKPTSPGSFGFNFNEDLTSNPNNFNNTNTLPGNVTSLKRRSLGALGVENFDDTAMEELLQLTDPIKKLKPISPEVFNNIAMNPMTDEMNLNMTENNNISRLMNEKSLDNDREDVPSTNEIDTGTIDSNTAVPIGDPIDTMLPRLNALAQEMKSTYTTLLLEKDNRISQLQRDLEMQRQECQWLKRMLIEDMGYVRGVLKDMKK